MLAAFLADSGEPGTQFNTLDGVNTHQGVSKVRFELVEHGLAQTDRNAASKYADFCTDRVTRSTEFIHKSFQFSDFAGLGAKERVRLDRIEVIGGEQYGSELREKTLDPYTKAFMQIFAGDSARRDAHGRFASR